MTNEEKTILNSEATSALDSLTKIERDTNRFVRPPLWLNVIISCSYGMMTFSWASTRHENLWMLGLIISTVTFVLAVSFYLYSSRLLGTKPKLLPREKSEFIFQFVLAIIFAVVFILTRMLSVSGVGWAAYVGGAINALLLAYSLHNFSTGKYVTGANRHE